jgi:hypothetical protein
VSKKSSRTSCLKPSILKAEICLDHILEENEGTLDESYYKSSTSIIDGNVTVSIVPPSNRPKILPFNQAADFSERQEGIDEQISPLDLIHSNPLQQKNHS